MKEILRSLRNKYNYSQSAVASYLGISRQVYNKYENGSSEPSLKTVKSLCDLYKVSPAVFFQESDYSQNSTTEYSYNPENISTMHVNSPSVPYNISSDNNSTLLNEIITLIPKLRLTEQISLMSKLASNIEKQSIQVNNPELKTKKLKKIPDKEYNSLLSYENMNNSNLSRIKELLKNDEW